MEVTRPLKELYQILLNNFISEGHRWMCNSLEYIYLSTKEITKKEYLILGKSLLREKPTRNKNTKFYNSTNYNREDDDLKDIGWWIAPHSNLTKDIKIEFLKSIIKKCA
jgi:hypothetical protein